VHPDRIGVRAGVEDHLGLAHQAAIDEHPLMVKGAERGHRARFAVWIRIREFLLVREAHGESARQRAQGLQVHHAMRRKNGQNELGVRDAHDDLRPGAPRHVRHRRFLLGREGGGMPEGSERDSRASQKRIE
jgi:hypothetical protein